MMPAGSQGCTLIDVMFVRAAAKPAALELRRIRGWGHVGGPPPTPQVHLHELMCTVVWFLVEGGG